MEDILVKNYLTYYQEAAIGVFLVKNRVLIWVNEFFLKMLGYQSTELIGKSVIKIYPSKEEYSKVDNKFYKRIAAFKFGWIDTRFKCKDGHILEIDLRGTLLDIDDSSKDILCVALDITDRILAKNKLLESEERFRTLFNCAHDAIFLHELSSKELPSKGLVGTFIEVNDEACRSLGYSREELLLMSFKDITPPEIWSTVVDNVKRIADYSTIKTNHISKDGTRFPVEVNFSLITIKGKKGLLAIVRDISSWRTIESSLRMRFRIEAVISQISNQFVHTSDLDKTINDALRDIGQLMEVDSVFVFRLHDNGQKIANTYIWYTSKIKFPSEGMRNVPIAPMFWMVDHLREKGLLFVEDLRKLPNEADAEKNRFGRMGIKSMLIFPLFLRSEFSGFIGIADTCKYRKWSAEDIRVLQFCTEIIASGITRQEIHQQLINAHERLEEQVLLKTNDLEMEKKKIEVLMNTISNGIIVLDSNGELSFYNKAFEGMYHKICPEGHFQCDCFFLVELRTEILPNLLKSPEQETFVEPIPGLHLKLSLSSRKPLPSESFGTVVEVQDVSYYVEFEKVRRQFVSTVSHELRTPITAIMQSISNQKKYSNRLSELDRNHLNDIINRNAVLLTDMIEDLLLISRIDEDRQKLEWVECPVVEILVEILNQLEPKIVERDISISVDIRKMLTVEGDRKRVSQILRILIDNAIKYSNRESTVNISAFDQYFGIFNPKSEEGVLIQVKDSGIGIQESELPFLFTRFFRSKNVKDIPGTGLGLSIAKKLVQLHKGEIFVDSVFGKGSTFSIFLPRKKNN